MIMYSQPVVRVIYWRYIVMGQRCISLQPICAPLVAGFLQFSSGSVVLETEHVEPIKLLVPLFCFHNAFQAIVRLSPLLPETPLQKLPVVMVSLVMRVRQSDPMSIFAIHSFNSALLSVSDEVEELSSYNDADEDSSDSEVVDTPSSSEVALLRNPG